MAISGIDNEPAEVTGAYRPIIFDVEDDTTPPVLYCDVYFGGTYYCTISKTQFLQTSGAASLWRFDIQNAAQDYLGKFLGTNGGTNVESADPMITICHCQFRSSTIDTDGFTVPEDPVPIQATDNTAAVAGGGLESDDFWIVNAALQQEDTDDLRDHLNSYKNGGGWAGTAYPLTHRPALLPIGVNDSDHFPFLSEDDSVSPCSGSMTLYYKFRGAGDGFFSASAGLSSSDCAAVLTGLRAITTGDGHTVISWDRATGAVSYNWSVDGGDSGSTSDTNVDLGVIGTGDFSITVTPECDCADGQASSLGFTVTNCVDVDIDSQDIPNGVMGVAYSGTVVLIGSAPFIILPGTQPAWMTTTIVGNTIYLTGTPNESGTAAVVFCITNCTDAIDCVDVEIFIDVAT